MFTQLPPVESQYCDSPEKGVRVLAMIDHDDSYQIGPISPTHHDSGEYTMTIRVNHTNTWKPFNISIAAINSVGPSIFSDPVTVRGPINGKSVTICILCDWNLSMVSAMQARALPILNIHCN